MDTLANVQMGVPSYRRHWGDPQVPGCAGNNEADMDRVTELKKPLKKKRGKHSAETRLNILESALTIFSESGFEGATIRDIAARAGVNHAMINYYFNGKEELWRQSVDHLFAKADDVLKFSDEEFQILAHDPQTFFKTVVSRYIRFCADHPDYTRVLMQESVCDSDRLGWAAKKYSKKHHSQIIALLRMAQDSELLPDVPLMPLVYIVLGSFHLRYALAPETKQIWGHDIFLPEHVDAHIQAVLQLVFRIDA